MRRVTGGQAFKPDPPEDHNLKVDAAEDYQRRILGEGGKEPRDQVSHNIVKVKPNFDARRGEIGILLGGIVTSDIHVPPERIIFECSVPEDDWWPSPGGGIAIFMEYAKSGETARAQMAGVCFFALVDVVNAAHSRASPIVGSKVLESGLAGPIRILYKPAGTGEKECVVEFMPTDAALQASITIRTRAAGIPGRVLNAMGGATCDVLEVSVAGELCFSRTETIWNISDTAVDAEKVGKADPVIAVDGTVMYIVDVESCNTGGFDGIVDCV